MDLIGLGITWEDLPLGRKFRTVSRTISESDLVCFINASGMLEILFTNTPADPPAPRLIPAALLYSFAEGLLIQSTIQGRGVAFLNMELNMKGPTYVGDTIHVECEVIESRASKGKPGTGLIRTRNQIVKQDGTVVMEYTPLRLIKGRDYQEGKP